MTQDEIIEMARQAGMVVINDKYSLLPFLEVFAKLVASAASAKERSECAKVCEEDESGRDSGSHYANAIRERGNV